MYLYRVSEYTDDVDFLGNHNSASLGGHTRATDQFLTARDEAARLAKPRGNWHALPLRSLAPVQPRTVNK